MMNTVKSANNIKIMLSLKIFLMYFEKNPREIPGDPDIIKNVKNNYFLPFTLAIASLSSVLIPTALSFAALTLLSASM